jgi:drug/metabolite transporter, DME family
VALFSAALLHERLTAAVGGALACALIGTVLLVSLGPSAAGSQVSGTASGILLALGAALCFGAFILVSRLLANRYHPLHSIALAVSIGGLLLLAILAVTTGVTAQYSPTTWALFLYLGLVPTALAYGLFFHGMKSATAAEASIAALAEPLTSTVLALVIFGERLGALGLLGAALLVGAIAFLYHNGPSGAG